MVVDNDQQEIGSIEDVECFMRSLPTAFQGTSLQKLQEVDICFQTVRSNLSEEQALSAAKLRFGSSRVALVLPTGPHCRFNEEEQLLCFHAGVGFYYSCLSGDCAAVLEWLYQDSYVISTYREESNWQLAWLMTLSAELGGPMSATKRRCWQQLRERFAKGNPYAGHVLRPDIGESRRGLLEFPDILPGRVVNIKELKVSPTIIRSNLGQFFVHLSEESIFPVLS